MSQKTKEHLVSIAITFLATLLTTLGGELAMVGTVQITGALVVSILLSAVRTAVKITIEKKALDIVGATK
jgi:hypothetical protein